MVADDLTNGEHVCSEEEGTKDETLRITAHNGTLQITVAGWESSSIHEDQLVAVGNMKQKSTLA